MFKNRVEMKRKLLLLAIMLFAALLLNGCGLHVNINKGTQNVEEMLADQALTADPVAYNADGSYTVTFHYDKGGFLKMDLSQAYIAYDPITVQDQIEAIVGEDTEDIPPLPADAQNALDEATGETGLKKVAVIKVATMDDNTLNVSFTDRDNPIIGKEYFFIIPNAGLAGSFIPAEA